VKNSNPDNYEKNGQRVDLVYGNGFVRTPDGKLVIDPVLAYMSAIPTLAIPLQGSLVIPTRIGNGV